MAAEVHDDAGQLKGVRPLGGTIEFGETAHAAVIREFQEELGVEVHTIGAPMFMENLYVHEGEQGHEILVIFDVAFPADAFANRSRITFVEDNGTECTAGWFALEELDQPGGPALFPTGLKARLLSKRA